MPALTYNGYTLPNIYGKFGYFEDYKKMRISCNFLVTASSESALVAACATAETALRQRYNNLTFSFGGTSEYSKSHSGYTYLLADPSLTKIESELGTATTRPYHFEVSAGLPADAAGYNYRQEASFEYNYGPSRQNVATFNLRYTAGGGASSYANYLSAGKSYATGILAGVSGSFELVSEQVNNEQETHYTNAKLVYKQILANQSESFINHSKIVDAHCTYQVILGETRGISDAGYKMDPSVTVTIEYTCNVDHDQVSNDTNMEGLWRSTIKSWLIKHSFDVLGLNDYKNAGTTYITQNDTHHIDPYDFKISGHLTFTAPRTSTSIIALQEVIEERLDEGLTVEPLWDGVNHTYNVWGVGARLDLTRTIAVTQIGAIPGPPRQLGGKYLRLGMTRTLQKDEVGIGAPEDSSKTRNFRMYTRLFREHYLYREDAKIKQITRPVITSGGLLAK